MRSTNRADNDQASPLPALLAILTSLIAGCVASVPEASSGLKSQALSFTPPQNTAGVYVIRQLPGAWSQLMDVSLDFKAFGAVAPETYLYTTVPPGTHAVSFPVLGAAAIRFTAEAGKNYFFAVGGVGTRFRQISEEEGQAAVRRMKPSGHNRYDTSGP